MFLIIQPLIYILFGNHHTALYISGMYIVKQLQLLISIPKCPIIIKVPKEVITAAYECIASRFVVVVVALLFYVHGKHLRSCRDGQLT